MKVYLGVDYAKKFSVATLVNEAGEVIKKGKLSNCKVEFERFLKGYKGISAVVEAGRNWHVPVDLLEGLVDKVTLAHPLKVKAIAEAKIKTDSIDSETLAQLLRAGLIPEAHLRSRSCRLQQRILRNRCFYVRMRTRVRNRVHHILDGQQEEIRQVASGFSDLFGKAGKGWLEQVELGEPEEGMLKELLATETYLSKQIQQSDKLVKQLFEEQSDAQRIETIPGFGVFLSVLTAVEIDGIGRFRSAAHLASYAGLVPSTYSSGGRTWHGKIHKQGSKWLRWALVEAAIHAAARPGDLRNRYRRIRYRKGTKIARVATARKLCSIVYRLLKQGADYQAIMKPRSRLQLVCSVKDTR